MAHKLDQAKLAVKKQKQQEKEQAVAAIKVDTGKKTTVSALAARLELIEKVIGL